MYSQTELIREIFDLVGIDFDMQRDNNSANRGLRSLRKGLDDLKGITRLQTPVVLAFNSDPNKSELAGFGMKDDGTHFDIIISPHFVYKRDVLYARLGEYSEDTEIIQGTAGTYFKVPVGYGKFIVKYRKSTVSLLRDDTGNIFLLPVEQRFVVTSGAELLALIEQRFDLLPFLRTARLEAERLIKSRSKSNDTKKWWGCRWSMER